MVSKEKFIELANKHLIALESCKINKEGNKPIEIFGFKKLYEALNIDSVVVPKNEGTLCEICYKTNEPCKHNCSGLCKESC